MRDCLSMLLGLGASAMVLFAAVSPPIDSIPDSVRVASASDDIWATFDPDGEFDHDGLPKDPVSDPQVPTDEIADESGDGDGGDGAGERGGPPNDDCQAATVIPGNTII